MSVFCPKCGKRTYNEYSCDHCQYEIKPNNYEKTKSIQINNNKIITISIVIIAVAVSYLAINKMTEDTPEEKALKALYGTTDPKEIKEINKKMLQDSQKDYEKAMKNLTTQITGNK